VSFLDAIEQEPTGLQNAVDELAGLVLLGLVFLRLEGSHVEGPEFETLKWLGEPERGGVDNGKTEGRCHGGAQRTRGGRAFNYMPVLKLKRIVQGRTPPRPCFHVKNNILMFNQFPGLLTFLYLKKSLYLFGQFSDRCHNSNKVFYKTSVNPCHPIEYLNLLGILRWWHVYYYLYFIWIW